MPFTIEVLDPNPLSLTATPIVADPPDLIADLPPFEQDSRDVQMVMTVIGNEFARLDAARQELIANFFPGSADVLLHFFEVMLGLPVDSPVMTLSSRQTAVLAFMQRLKSAGGGRDWVTAITTLVGTGWTFEYYTDPTDPDPPPAYTILIRLPYSGAAPIPTSLAAVQSGAGSFSNGATLYYAVTSVTAYGETVPSAPVEVAITADGSGVQVTWDSMGAPVTRYNVYRGLDPSTLALVHSGTGHSWTDDGSAVPGVAPPTTDTSSSPQAVTVQQLARSITPAHLDLRVGYAAGFIIGVSEIGVDAL